MFLLTAPPLPHCLQKEKEPGLSSRRNFQTLFSHGLSPFACHVQPLHFRLQFSLGNESNPHFQRCSSIQHILCIHPPLAEHNWKVVPEISRAIIFLCFILTFFLCVSYSFILCQFGAVNTANNFSGSTFVLVDGSFASLQGFFVTFPLVLDIGVKKYNYYLC